MPRGVTVNLASNSEKSVKNPSEYVLQCGAIKTECNGAEEQVIHRKSARRRVARDIFLVFEEQSSRRQGRGCNRKRKQTKSKFGHLKVENSISNSKVRANLLRDIKNEPKCYLNPVGLCVNGSQYKLPTTRSGGGRTTDEKKNNNGINSKTKSAVTVNPIFLWAKQEDTRIIEVRCEDYDKRNRIRITKTTAGWRAIPRSDASTSRIVKFFQTPSSLMKLKREIYDCKLLGQNNQLFIEPTNKFFSSSSTEAIRFSEEIEGNQQMPIGLNATNITKGKLDENQQSENNNYSENSNNCICDASHGDILSVPLIEECSIMSSCDQLNENKSRNFYSNAVAKEIDTVSMNSNTFQSISSELRLCPKTGLFFSSTPKDPKSNELGAKDSGIHIDITQCQMDFENTPSVDSVIGSPNTDATNLKDLLDDADLLQHYSDNINCNSELIDSLVKHSCKSTLVGQTEVFNSSECVPELKKRNLSILSSKDSIDEGIVDNMLPQLTSTFSEQHECLSFNEAAEIEEANRGIFQTLQDFSVFEKESIEEINTINSKPIETTNMPLKHATSITEGALLLNAVESTPKNLSCRKNEAQGHCAVTSSSDILHSPRQDEVPIVESPKENVNNIVLKQVITLNALNSLPNTPTKLQESEPIDLGQQKKEETGLGLRKSASVFLETVVIDDNSNDEPAKKKMCDTFEKEVLSNLASISMSTNIDKDPDPLTQLKLLLRNTQWKVPDPILVPKDRLGAVLASPAREIPLLITTRPELRLPEAFAYPHIIQNPNILVISMAQLEAILKNELRMEKAPLPRDTSDDLITIKNVHISTKPQSKDLNTKCSFIESNNMASDIKTATLAVINQMLRLPYVGQWSQEFLGTIQSPIGLQNQFTNLITPYNHSTFGLQHLNELYKNIVKQISNSKLHPIDGETPNFRNSPLYLRAISAFQNHVDLMLLQKILEQQIPNFPKSDQPSSLSLSPKKNEALVSFPECTSNMFCKQHFHTVTPEKCNKEVLSLNSKNIFNSDYHVGDVLTKSLCLKKASSDKATAESEQNKQIPKTKPRLTCKSLSNLLKPENRNLKTLPLINVSHKVTNDILFSDLHSGSCIPQSASNHETAPFKQVNLQSAESEKRRKCSVICEQSQTISDKGSEVALMQENSTITHPLLSSGINGYNSQWNWTTLTSTGE